ncbi:uncharacterized protein At2g29880-like [Vigna unguiculata]|uniref:uncharacterized protein At2g29880-like n=1 Tax=Vigna unguiculata TaxID=3917 RepID=UPI0010160A3A|nr:uncharacterized protein At2g29880-like [Vigna unguiculata]
MNRGKGLAVSVGRREFTKWTEDMDNRLLNAMLDEARLGNRVDGSWTTQAYNNMLSNLHEAGFVNLNKNNVKNRQKVLKEKSREVHDLFCSLSGFAWNNISKVFEAEDEVWAELLQSKPHAAKWQSTPIRHYDLMEELWSSDRATGEGVRTASQASRIRQQRRLEVDLNDEMEYTPEPPGYEPRENAYPSSPPSMDEYSPGPTQSVPSVPSGGTSSSRGSKRKHP